MKAFLWVLGGLFTIVIFMGSQAPKTEYKKTDTSMHDFINNVTLSGVNWQRPADVIAKVNFIIENKNDFPIKDVTILCSFYGASGTEIQKKSETIFEIVETNSKLRMKEVSLGFIDKQAATADCSVAHAKKA